MYCDITLMILQVCDGRVIVYMSVYIYIYIYIYIYM